MLQITHIAFTLKSEADPNQPNPLSQSQKHHHSLSFHPYNPLNAMKSESSPSSTQSKSFIQTQLHTHQHFISTYQIPNNCQIKPTVTQTQATPHLSLSLSLSNHSHPLFPIHSNHTPQSHPLPPIITILSPFTPDNQYESHIPSTKPHPENPPSTHITQQTPHNHTRYNTGDRNTATKNPTEYT